MSFRSKVVQFPGHSLVSALVLSLSWLGVGNTVNAGMYKWVDDEGQTIYSQQPPPNGHKARQISPPPAPPADASNTQDSIRKLNEKLDAMAEERRKTSEEKRKRKVAKAEKEKRCSTARQDLKTLNERPPNTLYHMPDGTWKRLTPEERAKRIEMLNNAIEKNCK